MGTISEKRSCNAEVPPPRRMLEDSAQGFIRPEGPAPKGQNNLAQGLPWVTRNKRLALKGLKMRAIPLKSSEPILAVPDSPFRANSRWGIPQGKPWAILFWPLQATD